MELNYYSENTDNPQYAGNIGSISWRSMGGVEQSYNFKYDGLSRLVEAVYETSSTLNEDYSTLYSYDIQGNIQTLKRNGPVTDGGNYFEEIDNLKYSYSGNRLTKVYNWAPTPGPYGFNNYGIFSGEGRDVYLYDANGNMRYDARTQREVEYNLLNLPRRITQSTSSSNHAIINYTYTASGQKISQQMVSDGRVGTRRDYAGSFVFVNNVLAWVNTPFGRIVNKEIQPDNKLLLVQEFHIRDHLGNTRVVLEGGLGTQYSATHVADYYPFGMEFQRGVKNQITPPDGDLRNNRYLYNGKELQDDFGLDWYDYGARFYDAQIARFHSVDPLAEVYSFQSPFAYAANNPIYYIDYMGLGPKEWWEKFKGWVNINILGKSYSGRDLVRPEREEREVTLTERHSFFPTLRDAGDERWGQLVSHSSSFDHSYKRYVTQQGFVIQGQSPFNWGTPDDLNSVTISRDRIFGNRQRVIAQIDRPRLALVTTRIRRFLGKNLSNRIYIQADGRFRQFPGVFRYSPEEMAFMRQHNIPIPQNPQADASASFSPFYQIRLVMIGTDAFFDELRQSGIIE